VYTLVKGAARGDPLPYNVFYKVIETPFVKHLHLEEISASMIYQEDWRDRSSPTLKRITT
jgi:hypothetical protein